MVVWIDVVGTNNFHNNRDNPVDDLNTAVDKLWDTVGSATGETVSIQEWEDPLPVDPGNCNVPERHKEATKNLENDNNDIPLTYYSSDFWLVLDHCKGSPYQDYAGIAYAGTAGIRTYKQDSSWDDDEHGHVGLVDFQAFNSLGVDPGPIQSIFQVCPHEVAHGFGAAHWDAMSYNGNKDKATLLYSNGFDYGREEYKNGLDEDEWVDDPSTRVSEFSSETKKWFKFRMGGINDYSHTPVDRIESKEGAKFTDIDRDVANGERSTTEDNEETIKNLKDARGG